MEKALAILRDPKVEIFSPDDLAMAKISSVVNCYGNAISPGLCNCVCTWCALGRAASFYMCQDWRDFSIEPSMLPQSWQTLQLLR